MSLPDVPSPALSTTPDLSLLPSQATGRRPHPLPRFAALGLRAAAGAAAGPGRDDHHRSRSRAATIPDALAGRDVLGRGQTGSGKTLGFGLPTLMRLAGGHTESRRPRGIVLVPTRELAMQVHDALEPLAHVMDVSLKLIAGGLPYPKQIEAPRRGVDLLIATPGRLIDLCEQGAADLARWRSPSSTRPTTCATWASCRRSPRCST